MLYSSGEVFPCTCTRVYVGIPRFFYIRLSTNPHKLYTKKICHCKICKIRMVIAFIAIFRTLLNACSPGVIHNFTKKGKKISTAISACKQASAGYIHRITEVIHHNCVHFVDNFYLLMHIQKKPYLCGGIHRKVRPLCVCRTWSRLYAFDGAAPVDMHAQGQPYISQGQLQNIQTVRRRCRNRFILGQGDIAVP